MENKDFTFVARIANYGGSGSKAAVLDKNLEAYYGLEPGDLIQITVTGIKKGVRSLYKKENVPAVEVENSQNRKNAEVRIIDVVLDENMNYVAKSISPQIRNKPGQSYGGRKNAYIAGVR